MSQPTIRFKKLHPDAALPEYKTAGAAGMDVSTVEDIQLTPGKVTLVPTGLAAAIPPGYELQVRPRSGLAAKYGVTVVNAPGTIDCDYRGEIKVMLTMLPDWQSLMSSIGQIPVLELEKGDRIAQLVLKPAPQAVIEETAEQLDQTARGDGGFGSTGVQS